MAVRLSHSGFEYSGVAESSDYIIHALRLKTLLACPCLPGRCNFRQRMEKYSFLFEIVIPAITNPEARLLRAWTALEL